MLYQTCQAHSPTIARGIRTCRLAVSWYIQDAMIGVRLTLKSFARLHRTMWKLHNEQILLVIQYTCTMCMQLLLEHCVKCDREFYGNLIK